MSRRGIAFGLLDLATAMATAGAVAIAALSWAGPAVGIRTVVLEGGSMAPGLPVGSLVVTVPVSGDSILPGDVVTFRRENGAVITHRVVGIVGTGDSRALVVKGDANDASDGPVVPVAEVIGREVLGIPYLGVVMATLATPSTLLALVGLFSIAWLVPGIRRERSPRPIHPPQARLGDEALP